MKRNRESENEGIEDEAKKEKGDIEGSVKKGKQIMMEDGVDRDKELNDGAREFALVARSELEKFELNLMNRGVKGKIGIKGHRALVNLGLHDYGMYFYLFTVVMAKEDKTPLQIRKEATTNILKLFFDRLLDNNWSTFQIYKRVGMLVCSMVAVKSCDKDIMELGMYIFKRIIVHELKTENDVEEKSVICMMKYFEVFIKMSKDVGLVVRAIDRAVAVEVMLSVMNDVDDQGTKNGVVENICEILFWIEDEAQVQKILKFFRGEDFSDCFNVLLAMLEGVERQNISCDEFCETWSNYDEHKKTILCSFVLRLLKWQKSDYTLILKEMVLKLIELEAYTPRLMKLGPTERMCRMLGDNFLTDQIIFDILGYLFCELRARNFIANPEKFLQMMVSHFTKSLHYESGNCLDNFLRYQCSDPNFILKATYEGVEKQLMDIKTDDGLVEEVVNRCRQAIRLLLKG